jgi:hypothetical protein
MALSILAKQEAIQRGTQGPSFIESKKNPLGYFSSKIRFINAEPSSFEPNEFFYVCEAVCYLGLLKIGDDDVWKYLIRRYDALSHMGNIEQVCTFIEGEPFSEDFRG